MKMAFMASKSGQGAFCVTVADDGTTVVDSRTFKTPREAYDRFRSNAALGDHTAWNICYVLEDVLQDLPFG
jgi:hypothetical protein